MLKEKKRIKKNVIYKGLGFPIMIDAVECSVIDGEEYYDIDFEKLKYSFLAIIMIEPEIEFVGGMLKFVRQSLELSMEEMAEILKIAKSTISKWEAANEDAINLGPFQKFKIKSAIKSYLDKIMEMKIERVLVEGPKKTTPKTRRPAPMKVPSDLSLSKVFERQQAFA
jgi:hypothetical protein